MKKQFILLIEGNPDDRKAMVRALRQSDIDSEIALARDGVEALDFLFDTADTRGATWAAGGGPFCAPGPDASVWLPQSALVAMARRFRPQLGPTREPVCCSSLNQPKTRMKSVNTIREGLAVRRCRHRYRSGDL